MDTQAWLEAKQAGLVKFRNNKSCRRGHEPFNYVSTGGCVECAKLPYSKRRGREIPGQFPLKKPNPRQIAAEKGEYQYWTERPCKRGHRAYRYTNSGACSRCVAEHDKARVGKKALLTRELRVNVHVDDYDKIIEIIENIAQLRAICMV